MYCRTNCGYYARLCDDCAVHTKYLHRDYTCLFPYQPGYHPETPISARDAVDG